MGADAPQFPRNTHSRERSRHGHGDHEARSDRLTHQDGRNDGQGTRLSLLWVFAILNYLYCDLLGLMDPDSHPLEAGMTVPVLDGSLALVSWAHSWRDINCRFQGPGGMIET
jgi:hypothetical protein